MNSHLCVLVVEDLEDDMLLILRELRRGGYTIDYVRVETSEEMQAALARQPWDVVIADYTLPKFSAPAALKLLQHQQWDLPFIIISGTIGEETAVAAMKAGAHDFITKGNLARLVPAVERELREAQERQKRHKAERALRESEERFRQLAENVIESVFWMADPKAAQFLYVSPAYEHIWGRSCTSLYSNLTEWQEAIHPEERQRIQTNFLEQALAGGCDEEYRIIRPDGSVRWIRDRGFPIRDNAGVPYRVVGIAEDITERKLAEEALRQSQYQYQMLAEASPVGIFRTSKDGNCIYVNQRWCEISGLSVDQALTGWMKAVHPEDYELVATAWDEATQNQTMFRLEYRIQRPDGVVSWVFGQALPERRNSEASGYVGTVTDITEKKRLESQFLRAQRLESLGTLASGIAHDFNNLLTPILAISQLLPLKLPDLDEQNQQLIWMIEDNVRRGADLVKQILTFARGGEGKRVPLQIRHIISEVVQIARQTFPKAIEIRIRLSATDLWIVSADSTQLHQVLMNLCVNARDAMPNGGILSLAAENLCIDEAYTRMNPEAHPGSFVVITVADTGTGIPAELLEQIFDPFFTTKEVGKGTGLGLSTVLGIVKNHGGFVKVHSKVEQGTQFKVYLPAIKQDMTQQIEEFPLSSGHNELILIVDDELSIQQVTKTALENCNYRTLTASDGIEAISLYAEHKHDISLVLMDVMMPSMDGLTAIRTLQKLNPKVKVVAMSGLATNSQLAQLIENDVKAFLPKPYSVKNLMDTLQSVLAIV